MVKIKNVSKPRQVVLVTCRAEIEVLGKKQMKDNIITLTWHSPLSFEPMMYGISIGKPRFSNKILSKSRAFCVNFIPYSLEEQAVFCGRHSGEHIDKFKETGLGKEECETIDCPRIAEAAAYAECEIIDQHETGDHVFYVGKITKLEGKSDAARLFQKEGGFTTTK